MATEKEVLEVEVKDDASKGLDKIIQGSKKAVAEFSLASKAIKKATRTMAEFGFTAEEQAAAVAQLGVVANQTGQPVAIVARALRALTFETQDATEATQGLANALKLQQKAGFGRSETAARLYGQAIEGSTGALKALGARGRAVAAALDGISDAQLKAKLTLQLTNREINRQRNVLERTGDKMRAFKARALSAFGPEGVAALGAFAIGVAAVGIAVAALAIGAVKIGIEAWTAYAETSREATEALEGVERESKAADVALGSLLDQTLNITQLTKGYEGALKGTTLAINKQEKAESELFTITLQRAILGDSLAAGLRGLGEIEQEAAKRANEFHREMEEGTRFIDDATRAVFEERDAIIELEDAWRNLGKTTDTEAARISIATAQFGIDPDTGLPIVSDKKKPKGGRASAAQLEARRNKRAQETLQFGPSGLEFQGAGSVLNKLGTLGDRGVVEDSPEVEAQLQAVEQLFADDEKAQNAQAYADALKSAKEQTKALEAETQIINSALDQGQAAMEGFAQSALMAAGAMAFGADKQRDFGKAIAQGLATLATQIVPVLFALGKSLIAIELGSGLGIIGAAAALSLAAGALTNFAGRAGRSGSSGGGASGSTASSLDTLIAQVRDKDDDDKGEQAIVVPVFIGTDQIAGPMVPIINDLLRRGALEFPLAA